MKRSIKSKINLLIIISVVTLAFAMALSQLLIVGRFTAKDSEAMMQNTCAAKTLELNKQFELVEQSVRNIYDISEALRPSLNELCDNPGVTEAFIRKFIQAAIGIANNTDGAIAVYYRVNPDINDNGRQGFFYVRSQETGRFEEGKVTDLLKYDVNDIEHVGWYYVPVWAGQAVWMDPYFNANIGVSMTSYVVPVYDGTRIVGVVGMDVDFERIINIAEDFNIYKSSGAALISLANSKVYHKKCDIFGDNAPSDLYNMMQGDEESESMFSYKTNGVNYLMCYKTLHNRMKLIAYASRTDVNEQAILTLISNGIILAVSSAVTLIIAMHITKKITVPIETVANAAKEYANGNWDVEVICDTDDELKVLTDNISIMAENTRHYIAYINDMAKKDGLTGLKNKTSYMMYVDNLKHKSRKEKKEYAVVVFDLNNLKYINDNFGHEKGDELILAGSRFICSHFSHSPIFRIGGDEFVAVLDSADYPNRDQLIRDFQEYMKLASHSKDEFDVCIACGMAVFSEDGTTYEEVFHAADQKMYLNKNELKENKGEYKV